LCHVFPWYGVELVCSVVVCGASSEVLFPFVGSTVVSPWSPMVYHRGVIVIGGHCSLPLGSYVAWGVARSHELTGLVLRYVVLLIVSWHGYIADYVLQLLFTVFLFRSFSGIKEHFSFLVSHSGNSIIILAPVAWVVFSVVGWAVPAFDAQERAQSSGVVNTMARSTVEGGFYNLSCAL
jgi:hypothetical protein